MVDNILDWFTFPPTQHAGSFKAKYSIFRFFTQHCLKGKTVYAPQIVFLNCYGSSAHPQGRWYHNSYGTIAMYKEDWDKFGGFSPGFRKKVSWDGEDWDIIDNAVKAGLEVERKRGPWIYHYQHDKNGMW